MAAQGGGVYNTLTRSHGVKVLSGATVEECVLAAGKIVGCENIMAASRMNGGVVMFLNTVKRANDLVDNGVVVGGALINVHPLTPVSRKVIISNVPPFIKDETLVRELARFGRVVAPIRKLTLGGKSELLRHVVSFKRLTYMVLNNNHATELQRTLTFKIDGVKYVVYVSTLFSPEEKEMLKENCVGSDNPDEADPIPELCPGLGGSASPL